MLKITDRVSAKWKDVALRLHFEGHCIDIIEINCHYQAVPACRTMFTRWLEGYGHKPKTWRTLIIALKEANLSTVAEKLEKMFPNSSPATSTSQANSSPAGILSVDT